MPRIRPARSRGHLRAVTVAAGLAIWLWASLAASAQAQEQIGYRDMTVAGISGSAPTGSKPESKLWFNDGIWWGVLFDDTTREHHIFRLDTATQQWSDTGTVVDDRRGSRADVMWKNGKLYVASHLFTNVAASGDGAKLYRFSYDPLTQRYTLDSGFPVYINSVKTETITIDMDSTGHLWATWTAFGEVYVNTTTTSDRTWGVPFALPEPGASGLTTDDISALIAFDGNKIGVMWGSQSDPAYRFAVHEDGEPATTWDPMEPAVQGVNEADDHINLKTTADGRVFAAVKTSQTNFDEPLTLLLVRDPTTHAWSQYTFGLKRDRHTRPIIVIDETNQWLHMFATAGEAGGAIYEKRTPLDAISFPSGRGRIVMQDPLSDDINDATSTKQNVTEAMGLPVLASDDSTDYYWHMFDPLVLGAKFKTTTDTSGLGPLTVGFADDSTGYPTAWSWSFGDGTTSNEQNPSHTYTATGSYDVTLTVTDAKGRTSTQTRRALVTVKPSVTFTPSKDVYVSDQYPDRNYASFNVLKVRYQSLKTVFRAFVSFDVSGLAAPPTAAKLRLYVNNASTDAGTVHVVTDPWSEQTLTWNNQPAMSIDPLATIGKAPAGYIDIPLPASAFAGGNGTYSFGLQSPSPDDVWYDSKETTNPPKLVLGTG